MSEISSNNQLNCLTIPRRTEHTVGRNIIHKLFSHSAEALMENFVSVILWVNAGENWEKFCVLCESFSFPLLLRLTIFERHENDINKQIHVERMRDKNKEREEIKKKNWKFVWITTEGCDICGWGGFWRVAKELWIKRERELNDCWENCCMKYTSACVDNAKIL